MKEKTKIVCSNCGTEFKSVNRSTPKSEGWVLDDLDQGLIFCCCVCRGEYHRKPKTSKKKK
jgi:hypothetical protein